jgi:hypothetical protein
MSQPMPSVHTCVANVGAQLVRAITLFSIGPFSNLQVFQVFQAYFAFSRGSGSSPETASKSSFVLLRKKVSGLREKTRGLENRRIIILRFSDLRLLRTNKSEYYPFCSQQLCCPHNNLTFDDKTWRTRVEGQSSQETGLYRERAMSKCAF